MPLSNAFRTPDLQDEPEVHYPLHTKVCEFCFLVQVGEVASPETLFREYPYFSSYSSSWLAHAAEFAKESIRVLGLGSASLVVEIASNDGYLLKNFHNAGIQVLGIEPAHNVARVAKAASIPTVEEFFDLDLARKLAKEKGKADLLVANNVLAHVPNLINFTAGLKELLKPGGVLSLEFPHLLKLMEELQFDTIYHEHFCYFSLWTVERLLGKQGLKVYDARNLKTHGGSLRLYAGHPEDGREETARVCEIRELESSAGIDRIDCYAGFADRVRRLKRELLTLLISIKEDGKSVVAYGAPAKGTILLNYCGIREDFLEYAVDLNPAKQGRFIPGTGIPVVSPQTIFTTRPEFVLILPWNLQEEITEQMKGISEWGGKFIVPLPSPRIL